MGGGAERIISTLASNMPDKSNTYLIVYKDVKCKYPCDCNIINIDIPESHNVLVKIINTIRKVYRIRKIKKELKIEKTISFLENPNIINILSRYNDKVIISIRNQKSKEIEISKQKFQRVLIERLYNKADKIVSISYGVERDLIENFKINRSKSEVIYNPIDVNYINSLKCEKIEDKYKDIFTNKTIITSGRLSDQKGQINLIRAFSIVREKIPDSNLVILGTGELEAELLNLIQKLNLEQSVQLLGFKENPFKYIHNSEVFILPSLFEGFGNVILESMACDTIVISTDCPSGPKEILNPTNLSKKIDGIEFGDYGILIPVLSNKISDINHKIVKEEYIMAEAIINILNNDRCRYEYKSRLQERVSEFHISKIIEQWCNL